MVTSVQLRVARAYLGWTMEQVAKAADLHHRTVLRLENNQAYAGRQPTSLRTLVSVSRAQGVILEGGGLTLAANNHRSEAA